MNVLSWLTWNCPQARVWHLWHRQVYPFNWNPPTLERLAPRLSLSSAQLASLGFLTPRLYRFRTLGSVDPTRLLLTFNVSVNLGDKYHKNTALHWAVLAGNTTVISLLLDANANVDSQNIKVWGRRFQKINLFEKAAWKAVQVWQGAASLCLYFFIHICFRGRRRSTSPSNGRTFGWSTTCRRRGRPKATTARPTWRGWRWTRCANGPKNLALFFQACQTIAFLKSWFVMMMKLLISSVNSD